MGADRRVRGDEPHVLGQVAEPLPDDDGLRRLLFEALLRGLAEVGGVDLQDPVQPRVRDRRPDRLDQPILVERKQPRAPHDRGVPDDVRKDGRRLPGGVESEAVAEGVGLLQPGAELGAARAEPVARAIGPFDLACDELPVAVRPLHAAHQLPGGIRERPGMLVPVREVVPVEHERIALVRDVVLQDADTARHQMVEQLRARRVLGVDEHAQGGVGLEADRLRGGERAAGDREIHDQGVPIRLVGEVHRSLAEAPQVCRHRELPDPHAALLELEEILQRGTRREQVLRGADVGGGGVVLPGEDPLHARESVVR